MGRYLLRRLGSTLITLALIITAGFLLVELIPGDPAPSLAGPGASEQTLDQIRQAYEFDQPFLTRFTTTFTRLAQGDLGFSFSRGEPVTEVLVRSLPPTLLLTTLAFLVEVAIGIPLALWVISRRGRWADRMLVAAAGATSAIPAFLVGLIFIYLFAFVLGWFPLGGGGSISGYVLPVFAVGIPFGLVLARLLRNTLLQEADEAYVVFAAGGASAAGRSGCATCCQTPCSPSSRCWRSTSPASSPAWPWSRQCSRCLDSVPTSSPRFADSTPPSSSASGSPVDSSSPWSISSPTWPWWWWIPEPGSACSRCLPGEWEARAKRAEG